MRRTTYGVWCLVLVFVWPILYTLPNAVLGAGSDVADAFQFAIMAFGLYVSWCVAVQRAHDMGRSWTFVGLGWSLTSASLVLTGLFLVSLMMSGRGMLPAAAAVIAGIAGLVVGIMLAFGPPDADDRWGPDPR